MPLNCLKIWNHFSKNSYISCKGSVISTDPFHRTSKKHNLETFGSNFLGCQTQKQCYNSTI